MRTGLTDLLRSLAARPQGFDTVDNELGGWSTEKVGNVANRLVSQGDLFRGKASHKTIRYFDTQDRAEAFVASKVKPVKNVSITATVYRAPPEWAGKPGVETPDTIYTACPPYRPRFQSFEIAGVRGGLQPGRVLKDAPA